MANSRPLSRIATSLDHLVGAAQQSQWNDKSKGLGRLKIDNKFDFHRLLDRQISRLFTFDNSSGKIPARRNASEILVPYPINPPASTNSRLCINRWKSQSSGRRYDLVFDAPIISIGGNDKGFNAQLGQPRKCDVNCCCGIGPLNMQFETHGVRSGEHVATFSISIRIVWIDENTDCTGRW